MDESQKFILKSPDLVTLTTLAWTGLFLPTDQASFTSRFGLYDETYETPGCQEVFDQLMEGYKPVREIFSAWNVRRCFYAT